MPAPFGPTMPSRSPGSRSRSSQRIEHRRSPSATRTRRRAARRPWSPDAAGAEAPAPDRRRGRRLGPPLDDRGGGGDARLGLARPGRRPATEPGQLAAGQVAADVLGGDGLLLACRPAVEVGGVPRATVLALCRRAGRRVPGRAPGPAVVTRSSTWRSWVTSSEPAGERGEALLQPGDGVEVEVVGRLVEDQQVVLVDEEPGQRHPLGLAPGERRRVARRGAAPIPSRSSMASPCQPSPTASRTVPGGSCGTCSSMPIRTPRPRRTSPDSGSISPARTRSRVDFPRSVDADDADAVAAGHGHGEIGEQHLVRSGDRHGCGVDQDHGGSG